MSFNRPVRPTIQVTRAWPTATSPFNPTAKRVLHPEGHVRTQRAFTNWSSREIVIIERTGLRYIIPAGGDYMHNNPTDIKERVIVEYTTKLGFHVNIDAGSQSIGDGSVADTLCSTFHRPSNREPSAAWHYQINHEEILACGGVIYDHHLDVVISLLPKDHPGIVHPYAQAAIVDDYLADVEQTRQETHFRMFFVDRFHRYSRIFSVFGDEPFEIPEMDDPSLEDGVHMFTNGWNAQSNGMRRQPDFVSHLHYSFEAMETGKAPFKIYTSYAHAKQHGDAESVFEMRKLEHKNVLMDKELAKAEMVHKTDVVKNVSANINSVFGAIGGLITLAAIVIKFRGGKKDG